MKLVQIELAARAEQIEDDLGPAFHIRQPAERANAGVDDIERTVVQRRWGVVDVGRHEAGVDADLPRKRRGGLYGGLGKIEAGDMRAKPRP